MEPSNDNYTFATTVKGHTLTIHDAREVLTNYEFNVTIEGPRYNGAIVFKCVMGTGVPTYLGCIHDDVNWRVIQFWAPYGINMTSGLLQFDANIGFSDDRYIGGKYVFERIPEIVTKGVHDG